MRILDNIRYIIIHDISIRMLDFNIDTLLGTNMIYIYIYVCICTYMYYIYTDLRNNVTRTLLGSAAGAQPWKSIVAGRRSQGVSKNLGVGIFLDPTSPTVMDLLVNCM